MLILSRKAEEEIRLGENITVKVLSIHNGQVKLGIEAPRDVRVVRGELYAEIGQANLEASHADRDAAVKAAAGLIKPREKK
ncbi:MAG TPA: carbon storage regulator CsrA [Bacteroidota bacterium]|nr:carbon storage regulator CsrA [Bacteroidota bacterium]